MKKMLKLEINKAFKNKFFLTAILIGFAITVLSFLNTMNQIDNLAEVVRLKIAKEGVRVNPMAGSGGTLYNHWIWGESSSLGASMYRFLFPILLALPYGWSYCEEKSTGYMRNMITRSGKRNYFTAKYVATFLAGGTAMVLPLILNFISVAMIIPAKLPMARYQIYYGIFGDSLMSELYYTHPLCYVCVYLLIDFIYAGLLANLSLVAAVRIRWKWICVISPFLVCLLMDYCNGFVYAEMNIPTFSPFAFLHPVMGTDTTWSVLLVGAVILFVVTFLFWQAGEKRHEIY